MALRCYRVVKRRRVGGSTGALNSRARQFINAFLSHLSFPAMFSILPACGFGIRKFLIFDRIDTEHGCAYRQKGKNDYHVKTLNQHRYRFRQQKTKTRVATSTCMSGLAHGSFQGRCKNQHCWWNQYPISVRWLMFLVTGTVFVLEVVIVVLQLP